MNNESSWLEIVRKRIHLLVLSIFFLTFIISCDKPQATSEEFDEIDVSQEPVQIQYVSNEPIIIQNNGNEFRIIPVAEYKIAAVVVSKKRYHDGFRSDIAPFDLALAWGQLATPEYDKYITYSQSDRWYFYEYRAECPFNNSFVIPHSANNHIIPADENIRKAINTIKKKEKVVLQGFLVNVKGRYKGGNFWWNSSLKRTDSGDGSCELFYVKKVRIGTKVYE